MTTVNPVLKVNLEKICWSNGNKYYNEKVVERLRKATLIKGRPERVFSTSGSDTYHLRGSNGVYYEVILGKKERRGLCVCKDFEKNLERAKSREYKSVMPCKHLIKILCYRRATRK